MQGAAIAILVGLIILLALAVLALGVLLARARRDRRPAATSLPGAPHAGPAPAGSTPTGDPADQEARLNLLLEQLPAISWTVDRELRFTSSSGAGLAALGLKQGEVVGRSLYEYFQTTDRSFPPIAAHLRALEGATVGYQFEWGGRSFKTQVEPFRTVDRSITGAIGVAHDMTDMQRAYDALAQTMERYHDLIDNLEGVVWEADPLDLRTTFVSQQAVALFGHPMHRWLGEPGFWPALIHPEDRNRVLEAVRGAATDRQPRQTEYRAQTADGSWLTILHSVRRIGGDRTPPALRGLLVDITREKLLEMEALKAQKLDSIGLLAGGIAHDFNNLLHGAFGHLTLARQRGTLDEVTHGHLDQSEAALRRAQDLTTRLLTFARGGAPVRRATALRPIVTDAVEPGLQGSKVRVTVDAPVDLWPADVDPVQIGQVFGNLALNAQQAMTEGGVLRIDMQNVTLPGALPIALPPGRYVRIRFIDQGGGIPEADLPRVFDPYFTTKATGTGLGLATAWSIIGRHGGQIAVTSEAGRGATFTLHLPAAAATRAAGGAGEAPGRRGRILVLDDEEMIRTLLNDLLGLLGYEVVTVAEGEAAVRAYEEARAAGRRFDLVILDLTIRGGLGGREAFDRMRALDPAIRGVVSSGYSNDPVMARWAEHGFEGVLAKPYTIDDLAALLSRLLEGTL